MIACYVLYVVQNLLFIIIVIHGRRKEIQNGGALKLLDRADSSMRNKHHEVVLIVSSELELN